VVAQIFARRGQIAEARKQLQDYLEKAPAWQQNQVKDMLATLQQ
jgi:uncharacterized protein YneF (UPF0154 family)